MPAEKAVFEHIHNHIITRSLHPEFQSSYRQNHSTETALVKVTNDTLRKINSQEVTLLVMLDLNAVFETVNLNILLTRLNEEIGTCGVALEWFTSYLTNRGHRVSINGSLSECFSLDCGVPQMSCLGPLLFNFYASTIWWLRLSFQKSTARRTTHRFIWVLSLTAAYPRVQFEWWNVALRRSGDGWSRTDSLLMKIIPSLW